MVVKFFASKKGGGTASIDYLLDKRTQEGTAKILQGDEKLTREIIKTMTQKHKTCVGCLSFEEANINENTKKELMRSFEVALLTPQMRGRYNILWIEHTDKGRLELNFVIPKIDLESKKAFNPYFYLADQKRIEIWQDFINLKHNFTNPKDPAKENTIQGSKKQRAIFNDYEAIDSFLHEQVSKGLLTSRKLIVEFLKANSIEITREGKDYISLKLPDSKKAKRFKGGIYDEQFTSIAELSQISTEHRKRERAFNEQNTTAELERLKQELIRYIQSKARYYFGVNERERERREKRNRGEHTRAEALSKELGNELQRGSEGTPLNSNEIQTNSNSNQLLSRSGDYGDNVSNDIQVKAENDSIRERIMQRNRENATRARENAEQRSRALQCYEQAIVNARECEQRQQEVTSTHRERKRASHEIFTGFRKRVSNAVRNSQAEFQGRANEYNTEIAGLETTIQQRTYKIRGSINRIRHIYARTREHLSDQFRKFERKIKQFIERRKEKERRIDRGFSR